MNTEIIKESGGPVPCLEAKGTESASNVSTPRKKNIAGSPFIHCGKAELSHASLRISYEAFHEQHEVFIGTTDLSRIIKSRFEPAAQVKECRKDQGGNETAQKIGYACRTSSGKALKINTIHSGGDLLLPWSNLLDIVNHKRNSAPVSRIEIPEAPAPVPVRDIRAGLETRF